MRDSSTVMPLIPDDKMSKLGPFPCQVEPEGGGEEGAMQRSMTAVSMSLITGLPEW
jgi:hypothetical protein